MALEDTTLALSQAYQKTRDCISSERDFLTASILLAAGSATDSLSSALNFSKVGVQYELNPLVRHAVEVFGPVAGQIMFKASVFPLALSLLYLNSHKSPAAKMVSINAIRLLAAAATGISAYNTLMYYTQ